MAGPIKKPRIRKSAPTIREQARAAQIKVADGKPSRAKSLTGKVAKKLPKVKLSNPVTRTFKKVVSPLGKYLSWLAPTYFINAAREVRQVVWPSRRETWRLTLAVFIFAVVFGAMIAGVDKGLDVIFKKLIIK